MNTMSCPPCRKNPVMGSSDANVKLRRRTCAGKVQKSRNKRERLLLSIYYFHHQLTNDINCYLFFSIQEETPRFGDLVIKSDKEVQEFRNRIYTKIKRVIFFRFVAVKSVPKGLLLFFCSRKERRCVEVQLLKLQKLMLPRNRNVTKLAFFLVYAGMD